MSTAPISLRGRERQREETRQRVFDAALQIFRRDGVNEARIDDITTIAGVSRGSFYFHFPTKEHVLHQLLEQSETRVAELIEALPQTAPIDEVLGAIAAAIAREWEEDAKLFVDVGMVALKRTHATLEDRQQSPVRRTVARRVQLSAERGEVTCQVPAELLADLFLLEQFAVAIAWCVQPIGPMELALRGVAEIFLRGAGARPSEDRPQQRKKKKR